MNDEKKTEMKFNPDLSPLLQNHTSRYSLVIATAKRAREIAQQAKDEKEELLEKPVSLALKDLLDGEYVINEPEEIRYI